MYILVWFLGVICGVILFEILKAFLLYSTYRRMEGMLLYIAASLMKYKYHAIKIVEIAYSADESKKEECLEIVAKIHQKFDGFGDEWVKDLKSRLPYNTEYNDWKTAIQYIERLITENKQSN